MVATKTHAVILANHIDTGVHAAFLLLDHVEIDQHKGEPVVLLLCECEGRYFWIVRDAHTLDEYTKEIGSPRLPDPGEDIGLDDPDAGGWIDTIDPIG